MKKSTHQSSELNTNIVLVDECYSSQSNIEWTWYEEEITIHKSLFLLYTSEW